MIMNRMRRNRLGGTVAAALFALAAMLLGFAHHHAPPASTGPVVLAPDGTIAVLCLAEPGEDGTAETAPRCHACTLAAAAAAPPPAPPALASPPIRPVARVVASARRAGPPGFGWRPAQPRAPPLPTV
jgi:hypothetical protein